MPDTNYLSWYREYGDEQKIIEKIKQFRTSIRDILEPHHDDKFLLKWLKARDFDLHKAEKMIRESFKWRKMIGADTILNGKYKEPEVYRKHPSTFKIGFDKEHSVVRYFGTGPPDYKGFVRSMTYREIVRLFIHAFESDFKDMKEYREKIKRTDLPDTVVYICDASNVSVSKFYEKKVINYGIKLLGMYQNNYPESLKVAYIINIPTYYVWVYNLFKPFIHPNTQKKIKIYCTDEWRDEIKEMIDPKILPAFLGGEFMDPEGDVNCSNLVTWDCLIPESYYLHNRSELDPLKLQGMKQVTVAQRAVLEVPVFIGVAGSVLKWIFKTKNYSIKFGLFYKGKMEEREEILPVDEIESDIIPEENEIFCNKSGSYILYFDNSYSWITSKQLSYKVEIDSPDVRGNNN